MHYTGGMQWFLVFAFLLLASTPTDDKHRGLGVPRYKGCPGNAICSQETGQLRQQWKDLLVKSRKDPKRVRRLETFRRRQGIPLGVWVPRRSANVPGVHFDSPCEKNASWMNSEVFAQDLSKLGKAPPRRGYLLVKKKIQPWLLPRGDVPLYERNNRLYYNFDFEGEYYGVSIGSKGDVRLEERVKPLKPYQFPREVACPQKLIERFSADNRPDSHPECLELPSASEKKLTLLLGKDCV